MVSIKASIMVSIKGSIMVSIKASIMVSIMVSIKVSIIVSIKVSIKGWLSKNVFSGYFTSRAYTSEVIQSGSFLSERYVQCLPNK